jgi:hypothetical protein
MCRFPSQLHEGGQYLGLSNLYLIMGHQVRNIGQSPLTLTLESGVRFLDVAAGGT